MTLRERLQAALPTAIRNRDAAAVAALRSALAAIELRGGAGRPRRRPDRAEAQALVQHLVAP
jgi:uncharacterized protein YqeY